MNISVNTRLLLPNKLEGIGSFSHEILKRITQRHPEHTFHFYFDRPFAEEFVYGSNVIPHVLYPPARHRYLWYLFFEWSIPWMNRKTKADLFLSPDGYYSLSTPTPGVNVIHDINFEHRPFDLPPAIASYYREAFPKFAHKATRIATVSNFSKKDLMQTYQLPASKIDVVYNGCNDSFRPLTRTEKSTVRLTYTQGNPYFIYVGSLHPRKNIATLLKAFDAYKRTTGYPDKLVLVGTPMWGNTEIETLLTTLAFASDILFLGRQSTLEVAQLVGAATALTFVPFFEGFGIPLLEAMQSDIPIIASHTTSLPEVAGSAAYYVDPHSTAELSTALQIVKESEDLQQKLIMAGRLQRSLFSWDQSALKLWNTLCQVQPGLASV
ncbi:MAG: glycosyltransferase family 4 protein [Cytophagaceae bacterium]|nr:glycosyltransferase family 4 protein [Cytophagaceae bacterium]